MVSKPSKRGGDRNQLFVPQKELIRVEGERPSPGTFPKRTYYDLKNAGYFHVREEPPRHPHILVWADTREPVWRMAPPRAARPGAEVRKRRRPGDENRRALEREYREIARELSKPPELQRWRHREPPYLRLRHEYLRRVLKRPDRERKLTTEHKEWPARVADVGGWFSMAPQEWLFELRRWLIRAGELVPKPDGHGLWIVTPEDAADE